MALQEPARVEAGELAPGPSGRPPPTEQVAGVGLAIGDAVPALEDLLAGVVVAERGARDGVAHPLAGGVVAGLGPGGGLAGRRGEGPRRGGGGAAEGEAGGERGRGRAAEAPWSGSSPAAAWEAARRPGGRGWASEADRCVARWAYTTQVVPRNFAGPKEEEGTSTGP